LSFRQQARNLSQVRISRNVIGKNCVEVQLHGFTDASQRAYGACLYIQDSEGNIHTALLS